MSALDHYVKREAIPALIRRQSTHLKHCSLYELAGVSRYAETQTATTEMFDLHLAQS